MMQSISLRDHVTERASRAISFPQSRYRTRQTKTTSVCFQIGAPGANQDFVCLLWGEAEVRVAPILVPKSKPRLCLFCFWESGGTCRPMMQGISLCDHVTERDYSLFPLPYKPLPYG